MGGSCIVRGMVWTAAVCILIPASTRAAEPSLDSDPPAARLHLAGPVTLGGTAPLPLDGLPPGRYRLAVGGLGLAEARGRLILDAAGEARVGRAVGPIALLLPPGFVHMGQGEGARGWLLLAGAAGGATGALLKASDLADANDEADRARKVYEDAVSQEEFDSARLTLLAVNDRRADDTDLRNMWLGYVGAIWAGAAVESWLLTPRPSMRRGEDGGYVLEARGASSFGAALRSVLVPGAGQRYLGAPARGNRFTGAVLALGAGSILAQQSFLTARRDQGDAQRRYQDAETEADAKHWKRELTLTADRTQSRDRLRWGLVGATLGVYLWNVIDAAVAEPGEGSASGLSLNLTPGDGGLRAGLTWRNF